MIIIFVLVVLALPLALNAMFSASESRIGKMPVFAACLLLSPLANYAFIHGAALIGMPATEFAILALEFISFLVFVPIGLIVLVLNLIFGWKNSDRRPRRKKAELKER